MYMFVNIYALNAEFRDWIESTAGMAFAFARGRAGFDPQHPTLYLCLSAAISEHRIKK